MKESLPDFVVGIGGSAGGLYAYMALLDTLPSDTGMAFVILSHMLPTANNQLASLLATHTKMPLRVASDGMTIQRNHVYVNPPNADLRIENYAFTVVSPRTESNKQVDFFFNSMAKALGTRAIGVVLSGYDGDGTEGCEQIKSNGGRTFAQDTTATISGMPTSANAAGWIDFVLPPHKISAELKKLGSGLGSTVVKPTPK